MNLAHVRHHDGLSE